ncbi:unnamed protein product [Anisakis simplex]|uniref:Dystrophin-1 (inferred by orthology to a C. elegans protein) n=1 Tax=Anisakis simplex TaxID=6269 RepID=A0A0M3JTA4_ANISI|nr:unnamed protein product [Anisakis simplex]
MLFSGGTAAKSKKDDKKEKKPDKVKNCCKHVIAEDRYEIQENAFIRWANSIANEPIREISDIVDSKFLFNFVNLITGEKLVNSGSRAQDVTNALHAIDVDDRFAQVNVTELIDGNSRTICGVVWQLIQIFWKRYAPDAVKDQKLIEVIKCWCVERTQPFEEVQVNDFTSSWRDGYAINAILLSYNSELFDMDNVREMRGDERIEHAMGLAERHLNVPRLLNPKDFHSEYLDVKSVVTYLMMMYLSINVQAPEAPASSSKRNDRNSSASQSLTTVILRNDSQELPHTLVQRASSSLVARPTVQRRSSIPVNVSKNQQRPAAIQTAQGQYAATGSQAMATQAAAASQYLQQQNTQGQYHAEQNTPLQMQYSTDQQQQQQQALTASQAQQYLSGQQVALQAQYLAEQAIAQATEQQIASQEALLIAAAAVATQQPVVLQQQPAAAVQIQQSNPQMVAAQPSLPQIAPVTSSVLSDEYVTEQQPSTEAIADEPASAIIDSQKCAPTLEPMPVAQQLPVTVQQSVNVQQAPIQSSIAIIHTRHPSAEDQMMLESNEDVNKQERCSSSVINRQSLDEPQQEQSNSALNRIQRTSSMSDQKSTTEQQQRHHTSSNQPTESIEMRSRKSSSSSQRSSRRSRKSTEDTISEYELCLEQVLAWLLEAEEQANSMGSVDETDVRNFTDSLRYYGVIIGGIQFENYNVEVVKAQFREHEQFMQSLTESQDSVGRVLHRGQLLCQKLEEEKSAAILSQLLMVNSRWERVRELAMNRQNLLQQRLNSLQFNQLEAIRNWLDKMEEEIENAPLITLDADEAQKLILTHADVQEKIDEQQKLVRALSTFVAVVDDTDTQLSYENLEKLLHSVGESTILLLRWMVICEWAELRTRQLDGLPALITQYKCAQQQLSEWLSNREEVNFEVIRAVVFGQLLSGVNIKYVQQLESTLEAGHSDFISLSQLAVDLVAKLDASNGAAANHVRREVDTITQRWDNIVTRIDQQSQMLVKSGKAEVRQLQREPNEGDHQMQQPPTSPAKLSTVQFTSFEPVEKELGTSSTSTVSCSTVISPVDIFITNVKRVCDNLEPLIEWTNNFSISKNFDDIRPVIQICQGKLREIKEKEAEVNELHAELERIHNLDVGSAQLHLANDTFEQFTRKWSRIVTKISDALNTLSAQAEASSDENFNEKTNRIATELDDFFDSALQIVSNCSQISAAERETRLKKLREQLRDQEKNIAFLDTNLTDRQRANMLKNRATELSNAIDMLDESGTFVDRFERFLRTPMASAGDLKLLNEQLTKCEVAADDCCVEEMLNELKNDSSMDAKCEQLTKLGTAKRDSISEMLERSRQFDAKISDSENTVREFRERLESLKSEKLEFPELVDHFKKLRNDFQNACGLQKESTGMAEEIASLAACSDAANRNQILEQLKERTQSCTNAWKSVEENIDESINLIEKENKRLQQGLIRDYRDAVEALSQAIDGSAEAADAEEFSEHLDVSPFFVLYLKYVFYIHWTCTRQVCETLESLGAQFWDCYYISYSRQTDLFSNLRFFASRIRAVMLSVLSECEFIAYSDRIISDIRSKCETLLMKDKSLQNLERLTEKVEAAGSAVSINPEGEGSLSKQVADIKKAHTLTMQRTKERIDELECAIRGCEQFESSLAECQAWCNHVQLILSCRAANDISALDVPHEYKNAFVSGTLVSQLQTEFDDFERCIQSLREFVTKNASDWGSSERLQLQLDHVARQFDDLMAKFVEFKQPIGLEEKAERIARETAEMENSVDELTGLDANACPSALDHARQISRRLAQVKADLEDLLESEKKLVEERILEPAAEEEISKKLNDTVAKLNIVEQRSADIVNRLEKCISLLDRLKSDLTHLDRIVDDVESKLGTFLQSENFQITEDDRATLEALQSDLNKNESSLTSIEEIAESLRRESVKVDDSEIEKRWKRIRRVHGDLRAWIDTVNSMTEDGGSMLNQFESLYAKLEKAITHMESIEFVEDLSEALERNRAEKTLLTERYRRLLKTNANVETKFSLPLSQLEDRWNELEKRWERSWMSSRVRAKSPPQLRRAEMKGDFGEQINSLYSIFKIANDYIDFESYPVTSVAQWSDRIQDVSDWLDEYGGCLKRVLEEGRKLASGGRMELDVHDALESLDKVVDLANQVESGVKASKSLLVPVQAKADALERDIRTMRDVLAQLAARDLTEPSVASATQRDLLDRQVQLEYLHRKSDDVHRCLPGSSPNQLNTSMNEISGMVRKIEEQIAVAIRKGVIGDDTDADIDGGLDVEGDLQLDENVNAEDMQQQQQHNALSAKRSQQAMKDTDTVSMSSAGAQSLALEVQETEDERSRLEYVSKSTTRMDDNGEKLEAIGSIYVEMDRIEEALSKSDPFPYSNLNTKKQQLEMMTKTLNHVQHAIDDSQMTMDLMESEAAQERLDALRYSSVQRCKEVDALIRSWDSLELNLATSDELVKALDKMLNDVHGRNKSPDLDELDSLSLSFEDALQRALAQIQHTSLKAEPIIAQMDDEHADVLRDRLRDVGERWKQCEDAVREKRRRFDERLADQSELNNLIELLDFWCDEAEAECATAINSLNGCVITEINDRIAERLSDYETKRESLRNVERLKDRLVNAQLADPSTKHRTRRIVSELGKRISSIRGILTERKTELDALVDAAKQFQIDISTLQQFCDKCEKAIQIVENAKIFVPSGSDLDYVRSRQDQMDALAISLQDRWRKACLEEPPPDDRQKTLVEDVFRMWLKAKQRISEKADVQTLAQDSSSSEAMIEDSETKSALTPNGVMDEKLDQSVSEYGTLSEVVAVGDECQPQLPQLSHKEHTLLNSIVQLRHWLAETERDAALTVDLIDVQAIRDSVNQMQAFIEQLRIRQLELLRILDESGSELVREKTELTLGEWTRVLNECQRRKCQLNKMVDESRSWEQLRCSVQLLSDGGKVTELTEDALRSELKDVEQISEGIEEMRNKMTELNARSNALLDEFRADEGHNLSHSTSKMNTLWSKFNDNIRIRRAVLEAAIRARSDFHSALLQLEQWLDRIESSLSTLNESTSNMQSLKDSIKRKEWIDNEKSVRAEIDAHDDVVRSVDQMGTKLVRSVEDVNERERLSKRLQNVSERWRKLASLADAIRSRLTNAQEEWERLVSQLSENIYWCDTQSNALLDEQPLGGSLAHVQQQNEFVKNLEREIERRQRSIDECITLSHSYLMQHDLRPRMHTPSALASPSDETQRIVDIAVDSNAELRRVGIQIKSNSEKLSKKWNELKKQVNVWSRIIDDAHAKMEQLTAAIAECQLALSNMESNMENVKPVEELRLEELTTAVDDSDNLKECLARTRMHIDDANDCSGQLLASDVDLAPELSAQLKSVNERFSKLKVDVKVRVAALEHAIADFGPSSQHFLMNSVQPPWQRAVSSTNHLPYYINHENELTQWDHPVMVEIMEKLTNFNQVKFSAYRTAMKMRAIQKRLCLDLLSLQELDVKLQSLNSAWGEQRLAVKDAVMCLVPLFESAHDKFPHLIRSIPLAVDLFLNFMFNVYDPSRDGTLRTFSFKVALVVLCNANLEDKYKYLYSLISTSEGVDQKRLALLLYDIIHIPKFLGEAAAFGGSNVEPSVRSCFETIKFGRTISVDDFLAWLKKEPQSIVWLPVMHRLASAEFAKHQAKCNICKMFPIIGLRYRCLRCFNVDVCQNCFFSQRLAKNHKLSHPMQEYCLPTTSGEDVRDFGIIVKNKLRSSSRTRIGYLPVQTVDEGIPIETTGVTPINPLTEPLHNQMHLCAQRLWRARGEDEPAAPVVVDAIEEPPGSIELKSPLQLLSQVEQMHKEELDQVLHKLQHENRELKKEIERRKNFEGVGSTPNLTHAPVRNANLSMASGRSVPSLPNSTDEQLLREAHLLRQHKERLEQRSRILEDQNRQLEVQLARLRTVISQQNNTGGSEENEGGRDEHELSTASGEDEETPGYDAHPNRMHSLIASVDQLGRAMHSLIASVVNDDEQNDEDDDEISVH